MKNFISLLLAASILAGCATNNATQVIATMSGLQSGATLGGAIGGLTSRSPRGHFMGTTIGAISGAAIGAIATSPRRQTANREEYENSRSLDNKKKKVETKRTLGSLSGLKKDVRIVNVKFLGTSGGATLSSGGTATVSYDIINVTSGNIPMLVPKMEFKHKAKNIAISPMQSIVDLPSGEGVRYTVTITAGERIKNGDNAVLLYLSADDGATFTLMNELPFETRK
ncbi:MAG: hypothetical protein IKM47_08180 [Bacteroidaceae bacterium]|nr:hypothetical protein [Bacteroidaceae bacterium]